MSDKSFVPAKKRRALVNGKVDKKKNRDATQIRILRTLNKCDYIGSLPPEVIQLIFAKLPPLSLRIAMSVCPQWKNLVTNEFFWKQKCRIDGYLEPSIKHPVFEKMVVGAKNYWERMYMFNEALHQNWRKGKSIKYCFVDAENLFNGGPPQVHYFDDEFILMTDSTFTVFVNNYVDPRQRFTEMYWSSGFNNFVCRSLKFIVCVNLYDGSLLVWDYESADTVLEMPTKEEPMVEDVVVRKNLVAILFLDDSCLIIDILTGKVEYSVESSELISCVCLFADHAAFGTQYGKIHIVKWESKATVATFINIFYGIIKKILVSGDFLVCFVSSKWAVWNMKTGKMMHVATHTSKGKFEEMSLIDPVTVLWKNTVQLRLEAWNFVTMTCKFVIDYDPLDIAIKTNDYYIFVPKKASRGKHSNVVMIYCIITGRYVWQVKTRYKYTKMFATNTKLSFKIPRHMVVYDFEKRISLNQVKVLMRRK